MAEFNKNLILYQTFINRRMEFSFIEALALCEVFLRVLFFLQPDFHISVISQKRNGSHNPFMEETCFMMFSLSSADFRKVVSVFLTSSVAKRA